MMRLLFETGGGTITAATSQVTLTRAREGVGLPFHPQAETYLAAGAAPQAKPAAAHQRQSYDRHRAGCFPRRAGRDLRP